MVVMTSFAFYKKQLGDSLPEDGDTQELVGKACMKSLVEVKPPVKAKRPRSAKPHQVKKAGTVEKPQEQQVGQFEEAHGVKVGVLPEPLRQNEAHDEVLPKLCEFVGRDFDGAEKEAVMVQRGSKGKGAKEKHPKKSAEQQRKPDGPIQKKTFRDFKSKEKIESSPQVFTFAEEPQGREAFLKTSKQPTNSYQLTQASVNGIFMSILIIPLHPISVTCSNSRVLLSLVLA
jgi:hypothetical protein